MLYLIFHDTSSFLHILLQALLKACDDGRLVEVNTLIQMGVNVNMIRPSSVSPFQSV